MNVIRTAVSEFLGLFVDDGSLALFVIILIMLVTAAVKMEIISPLIGGGALLLGCIVVLSESLYRAAKKR
ncbi:hypothetical protein BPNPMPFG_005602 [Mesorhizobium sp. AR07]|uniref:hypothetical protein n=1 Tax=Mesorhizobium sp. AR07 TaxID=2865838 RepID=UPI00215E4C98|nr:hypothetical protein [Mesorhizobium sp. AR07]UVK43769.1 hypothetical protein BPNPMPFG_005602 [Mesorhizobium sp. AR07]